MKAWFTQAWNNVRFSYWFLPALMAVFAIGLSFLSIEMDRFLQDEWLRNVGWIWSGGPEGARGLLSTVAGSMITVVSLTFSITIVAFSQASSQFGPRLLRNFMKDTGNQFVLGTFTATYIYCLLILRTIRSNSGAEFTPHISVTLGVALALISLGVLIYFIHHVALSIQAPYLVANVARDLLKSIDRLSSAERESVPEGGLDHHQVLARYQDDSPGTTPVLAEHNGYLQGVDEEQLTKTAARCGIVLMLPHRPGHFVGQGSPVALVWPARQLKPNAEKQIQSAFTFGHVKTYYQDMEFAIEQLVEVAVRSLSPGINDPFTAMNCIDWLATALKKLAGRDLSTGSILCDALGNVRVVKMKPVTFEGMVEAAFNQIRQNSRCNVAVIIRQLEAIESILESASQPGARGVLLRQARMIANVSREEIPEEKDRKDIAQMLERVTHLYSTTKIESNRT